MWDECLDEGMTNWRVNSSVSKSPADTYIEWMFERKCEELSNGSDILTEWRAQKRQYIGWLEITAYDFQHFSRHDASHSINILEAIEMFLGKERIDLLSAGDLWMLLECAYKHDLGMTLTYEEILDLWEKDSEFKKYIEECIYTELPNDNKKAALFLKQIDNLIHDKAQMDEIEHGEKWKFSAGWPVQLQRYVLCLVSSYVRKRHAERLYEVMPRCNTTGELVIPQRLYKAAEMACVMHGENDYKKIMKTMKPCGKGFGNGKIHPRFACAMLRLGDLLDMDNNRFNPRAIEHFGDIPMLSRQHLEKHKAITHLKITKSKIEVEAVSADRGVCEVLTDWFRWLDEEVQNLICYWNEIVPDELRGCTMQKCEYRVYYGDEHTSYTAKKNRDFGVNKKRLINLFMGTNIYSTKMDFIREYLQNALDASKMRLWIDLKEGCYNVSLNPQIRNLEEITPFDLPKEIYDKYKIVIRAELDMNKFLVRLIIEDHGIGMEQQCISAISEIGQGWIGREEYNKQIHTMPEWLRPTGGFGIGLHSAFMVTDKVEIITKSINETKGRKVVLQSPSCGGHISEEEYPKYEPGTVIIVDMPLDYFQTWNQDWEKTEIKNYPRVKFDADNWDYFDERKTELYIQDFLKEYVKGFLNENFIPISVIYKNTCYSTTKCELLPDISYWDNSKDYYVRKNAERIYLIEKDAKNFCIWDSEKQVGCRIGLIESDRTLYQNRVSFKNIVIKNEECNRRTYSAWMDINMDLAGGNVEEILMLHRNSFRSDFYIQAWTDKYVEDFFEAMDYWSNQPDTKEIVQKWYESCPRLFLISLLYSQSVKQNCEKLYPETEKTMVEVRKMDDSKKPELKDCLVSQRDVYEKIKYILYWKEEIEEPFWKHCLIFRAYDKITEKDSSLKSGIQLEKSPDNIIDSGIYDTDYKVNSFLQNGGYIIWNSDICKMLQECQRFHYDCFKLDGSDESFYLISPNEKKKMENEELQEADFYKISYDYSKSKSRYYEEMQGKTYHKKLYVNLIPYSRSHGEKHYILSPINANIYKKIQLEQDDFSHFSEDKRNISWEKFRDIVYGDPSYNPLIFWVVNHQANEQKCSEKEIRNEYEKYLMKIYHYNIGGYD